MVLSVGEDASRVAERVLLAGVLKAHDDSLSPVLIPVGVYI